MRWVLFLGGLLKICPIIPGLEVFYVVTYNHNCSTFKIYLSEIEGLYGTKFT